MESSTGLGTLNAIITPLSSRSRAPIFRPFRLYPFVKKLNLSLSSSSRFSPLCSLRTTLLSVHACDFFSELADGRVRHVAGANGSSLPNGVGEEVRGLSQDKVLQVVLVSPQIPGNTGCIARTCAASAVGLHLVGPLGFQVDDAKLKRAGLDYWPYVVVKVHASWAEFRKYFSQQDGAKRLLAFTKRGTATHSDFTYKRGDWLVFGSETSGLPPEALLDCKSEAFGGGTLRIPMVETYVRCLNLSVSVGIAVYEASRQLNYEQLQSHEENCFEGDKSFIVEDVFA